MEGAGLSQLPAGNDGDSLRELSRWHRTQALYETPGSLLSPLQRAGEYEAGSLGPEATETSSSPAGWAASGLQALVRRGQVRLPKLAPATCRDFVRCVPQGRLPVQQCRYRHRFYQRDFFRERWSLKCPLSVSPNPNLFSSGFLSPATKRAWQTNAFWKCTSHFPEPGGQLALLPLPKGTSEVGEVKPLAQWAPARGPWSRPLPVPTSPCWLREGPKVETAARSLSVRGH